jgi:hypothetical protein
MGLHKKRDPRPRRAIFEELASTAGWSTDTASPGQLAPILVLALVRHQETQQPGLPQYSNHETRPQHVTPQEVPRVDAAPLGFTADPAYSGLQNRNRCA